MSEKYEKLKTLLMELFQLDQPDLDFGLYRIMHARREEVTAFLERDLLPQVREEFKRYAGQDKADIEKELAEAVEGAGKLEIDPESSPKVQGLRARLAHDAVDIPALEGDVYDHLYGFFRRYYSEGDFLSKRVYKPGVYAIPYEGEEVKLHWANADQYYVKTSESLRDYAFRLRPDDEAQPLRVHFRLVDAAEGEHGNVKAAAGKDRLFVLAGARADEGETAGERERENGAGPVAIEAEELVVRFEYRPATAADWDQAGAGPEDGKKPPAQKQLTERAEAGILAALEALEGAAAEEAERAAARPWRESLAAPHVKANGEPAGYSRLRAHLNRYVARNTFDYFIHKDLGGFLRRELDFYIKNEVMHLDDIEHQKAPRVEQYLSKIKVIRRIAGKVIDFLSQLEDFQKKLWLKKKFVVETSYCITVGSIAEEFYAEIAANENQWAEWESLYGLSMLAEGANPLFSTQNMKLGTAGFLKFHKTLVMDTRHYSERFVSRLIEAIGYQEEETDGLLIHSENYQALALLQSRFRSEVECVYIDPPYNTGDSEIPYKNTYLRSCWLSLMQNRLDIASRMLTTDPVIYIAIDDFEMANLAKLVDSDHASLRREMIIVNHHPQGGKAKTLAHSHEYMLACVAQDSDRTLIGRTTNGGVEQRPFKRSGTAESNFRYGRPNSFYAILVNATSRNVVGLERPPLLGAEYPTDPTVQGHIRVYPLGIQGQERVWRRSFESCRVLVEQGKLICSEGMTIYQLIEASERTAALFSNWVDPRYNAGTFGANLLRDIIGEQNLFSYPKSLHTVADAIFAADVKEDSHVLDFFAGSGTTGHAIIILNREDDRRRRFILVEMANHFDTVLLPRLKKIAFTCKWKDGRPSRLATPEEAARGPRIMKVIRLESYEDALNNLEAKRTGAQQRLLDDGEAKGAGGLREEYLLKYMLDVETAGSQSLLNVKAFDDPTAYRLKVKRTGSDETREVNVDLLETFNWLISLRVRRIAAPRSVAAEFERDAEGRLRLKGPLAELNAEELTTEHTCWFRTVTGATPAGEQALIIWRKRPGGESPEGVERDNLVLNEWFRAEGFAGGGFDLIYVNGTNNLESLRAEGAAWRVRLIEDDFHRLMFDIEGM